MVQPGVFKLAVGNMKDGPQGWVNDATFAVLTPTPVQPEGLTNSSGGQSAAPPANACAFELIDPEGVEPD